MANNRTAAALLSISKSKHMSLNISLRFGESAGDEQTTLQLDPNELKRQDQNQGGKCSAQRESLSLSAAAQTMNGLVKQQQGLSVTSALSAAVVKAPRRGGRQHSSEGKAKTISLHLSNSLATL